VVKFERRLVACLGALLSMPSISVSCRSLKTPRCVAWYLDLMNCSITSVLKEGAKFSLGEGFFKFSYVCSDAGEVFSKVEGGVNVYPTHFVGFVKGEASDM